ncbi:MAG: RDD family protein [Cyclobacteriaceae bacterium]
MKNINATFWNRLMAHNIDLTVLLPIWLGVSFLIEENATLFVAILIITYLYDLICNISPWQGTLGKKMMKMKVIGQNSESLGFGRSIIRSFIKILSLPILYIVILMVIIRKDKSAIHDLVVGSSVIISPNT